MIHYVLSCHNVLSLTRAPLSPGRPGLPGSPAAPYTSTNKHIHMFTTYTYVDTLLT